MSALSRHMLKIPMVLNKATGNKLEGTRQVKRQTCKTEKRDANRDKNDSGVVSALPPIDVEYGHTDTSNAAKEHCSSVGLL
jgi:hypothetical protein